MQLDTRTQQTGYQTHRHQGAHRRPLKGMGIERHDQPPGTEADLQHAFFLWVARFNVKRKRLRRPVPSF